MNNNNKRFYFSRSYIFKARKTYFLRLTERTRKEVTFCFTARNVNNETVSAKIVMDGDIETATFFWNGIKFSLRANGEWIGRGYPFLTAEYEMKMDDMTDAYMHTSYNRKEIELSKSCCCISCRNFFPPSEVKDYTDDDQTAICPYCGEAALIGDASKIDMDANLVSNMHIHYFDPTCKISMGLIIDTLKKAKSTNGQSYDWIAKTQSGEICVININTEL